MPAHVIENGISNTINYLELPRISDEIVVSGISGRLPEANNIGEFRDNLMNKIDMVTDAETRWPKGLYGLPERSGKIKDLSKFDANFFGVNPKQANVMDPQLRLLLEASYEAILDSGVNPQSIRGSKTGVFIGGSASEAHEAWGLESDKVIGYSMTGCTRSMFANRISFALDLKGPSYCVDTACSSSLLAFENALSALRTGQCDAAIVGGVSICVKPTIALQFQKLSMLSPTGVCKSFDADGNGYCRSEAVVAVFLQKAKDARRIYCYAIHAKSNSDGFKNDGITFPNGNMQKKLIEEVYHEANVDPLSVSYIEAHGTGTQAGDPQECNSLDAVFCTNRNLPLFIGSVKSNMGHPEPASGLAALAKIIISMEEGIIPPNLHYNSPNPNIPGLVEGRLKVVTELTPWQGGYMALNNFGFGGSNVHAILHSNYSNNKFQNFNITLPKLFVVSGRTEQAIEKMMAFMNSYPNDHYLYNLLEESIKTNLSSHPFSGYMILNSGQKEIQKQSPEARPVWYVFSGMGAQWSGMAKDMMHLNIFKNSIMKSSAILEPYGLNLISLLTSDDRSLMKKTLNSFVSVAAIQIALVDILSHLGIQPDGIVGHSVGELGCGYADGGFTSEEMILAAYWRGKCIEDAQLPPGGMAAVGLTWDEAKKLCPPGVVPACHNSEDTVTISGPKSDVTKFVEKLKTQDIFAKEVDSAGVAFHSYFMKPIGPILKQALDKVIKSPKRRSSRWISSSIPQEFWSNEMAQYCSAEYHANNLCSPVLFQEAIKLIPSNAITIEIAPHCLLQSILKRSLSPDCKFISLMKRGHENNLMYFMENIGRLFTCGKYCDVTKLYPSITYPVPKGTPMISPHVMWDHSDTWDVPTHEHFDAVLVKGGSSGCSFSYEVDIGNTDDEYLSGHKIDGRTLFPATGYIVLAWKALAKIYKKKYNEMAIIIENFRIQRATILSKSTTTHFEVNILPNTNQFEIVENSAIVASGVIRAVINENIDVKEVATVVLPLEGHIKLSPSDIYKELSLRGYEYSGQFRGIKEIDTSASYSKLSWDGNWITFLDTMLQSQIMGAPNRNLNLPNRINLIKIDPLLHDKRANLADSEVDTFFNKIVDKIYAGGVEMFGLHTTAISKRQTQQAPILEKFDYCPYFEENCIPKDTTHNLLKYKDVCEALIGKGLKQFLSSPDSLPNRDTFARLLEYIPKRVTDDPKTLDNLKPGENCYVLSYFLELFKLPLDQHLHKGVMKLYDSFKDQIMKDGLLCSLLNSHTLKPLLDVVIENCGTKIKTLEFGVDIDALLPAVHSLINMHPQTKLEFWAAGKSVETLDQTVTALFPDLESAHSIKTFQYDLNNSTDGQIPPQLSPNEYNLLVLNKTLHKCRDLKSTLGMLYDVLQPGGFCLVHETVGNFAVPFTIDALVEKIEFPAKQEDYPDRRLDLYFDHEGWLDVFARAGFVCTSSKTDGITSSLFLIRKPILPPGNTVAKHKVIEIKDIDTFDWIEDLQKVLDPDTSTNGTITYDRVWLVSKFQLSGLVGFVNCLRQESNGHLVRLVYDASDIMLKSEGKMRMPLCLLPHMEGAEWDNVIKKDLAMNVWDGKGWGSYRHSLVDTEDLRFVSQYAFINCLKKGDLSSLSWVQSELSAKKNFCDKNDLCSVTFAALNFRDIMLATGKLPPDAIPGNFSPHDCLLGMEFSGYNSKKEKVMGLVPAKGLATYVAVDPNFTWKLPAAWSLKDAATIPVVYATAYYALIIRGRLRKNESVLIHSGSGGVGQAAISIALSLNCTVYTTVGSLAKRHYLKKRFSQLSDDNFCNSRDLSFEDHIYNMTKGRGVDVVLNSLAEDKLQASVRLLAPHGRFLEIGKYDLSNDSPLGMSVFLRNVTFHGILLDALFEGGNQDWMDVHKMVSDGIQKGVVIPLESTIFDSSDVEDAFRFMAQGKHIGKVLIQIKGENDVVGNPMKVLPCVRFNPTSVYIITGGLGGFGLELTDWMIEKGAQKIVLISRSGIKNGYQASRIKSWQGKGIEIILSNRDITTLPGTESLIKDISPMGKIDGIFHLAAVLRDALFENQTVENFKDVVASKIAATINLDKVTRQLYPDMSYFVVFSSISCGRGNAGQTNYGLGNSTMERVCEKRKLDGLSALAIQWGAIGDVGLIMDTMNGNETVVGGTLPQRIESCLNALNTLLFSPYPVASSYVLAEKGVSVSQSHSKANVIDAIAHILGIKDTTSISQDISLADLGLDSLMGVEIKQTLEREYEIVLSIKEIRQLTFNKIKNLTTGSCESELNINFSHMTPPPSEVLSPTIGLDLILRRYNINELVPKETVVLFNREKSSKPIFLIHPIEGSFVSLQNILKLINHPVYGFQCSAEVPQSSVEAMAQYYISKILEIQQQGPYQICGYSFGATIAFEMAIQLQAKGVEIKPLIFLDGSHSFVTTHTQFHLTKLTPGSELEKYAEVMVAFVLLFVGSDYVKLKEKFSALTSVDDIIKAAVDRLMQTNLFPDRTDLEMCARYYYQKLMICDMYTPAHSYKSNISLIRVKDADDRLGKDYDLSKVCSGKIDIKYVDGDHETFILGDNAYKVIDYMNQVL